MRAFNLPDKRLSPNGFPLALETGQPSYGAVNAYLAARVLRVTNRSTLIDRRTDMDEIRRGTSWQATFLFEGVPHGLTVNLELVVLHS
jgi:hypothetical protein